MLTGSKEEHDLYVKSMLLNTMNDEKVFIMNTRKPFADNVHACAVAYKELQECEEEMQGIRDTLKTIWEYDRRNMPQEEILKQLGYLKTKAYLLQVGAGRIGANALIALEQLKDYKEDRDTL